MTFEGWDRNSDGTIKVFPVLGWDSFIPFGMMCGLRLKYAESDAALISGCLEAIPLIMTPAQARELAGVLTRLADKTEAPASLEDGH